MARSINNSTPSSRAARAAKRNREDDDSDPGTESTRRITDSTNSSLSPPIEEGNSQNRRISSSGKRRKSGRLQLPFNSGTKTSTKLRRALEQPVRSTRKLREIRMREKIRLTGELQISECNNKSFRGGNLATYPTIPEDAPDLIEFCSTILIHLGTAGCAKLLDEENPEKCEIIELNYNDEELCILAQGINIQNGLLHKKKELHVFNVLKYVCTKNSTLRSRVSNIKETQEAYKEVWKIINEYDERI